MPCVGSSRMSTDGRVTSQRLSATYERVILRSWSPHLLVPFSPWLRRELRGADIVHCHQYFVLPTFFAARFGYRQGSGVFVSDLGGEPHREHSERLVCVARKTR